MVDRLYHAIGLMSGTSADGVDAAFLRTDGISQLEFGPALTIPYPDQLRRDILATFGREPDATANDVARAVTEIHGQAVSNLLHESGMTAGQIDVIGFHGQTTYHAPAQRKTYQLGDGKWLASHTGIPVVNQFRQADVAAGGQGAPLVPLYHAALAASLPKPLAIVNIGGVANVTWIGAGIGAGADDIIAFDTGPGNGLIDDWMLAKSNQKLDWNGRAAAEGLIDQTLIQQWLAHEFFLRPPPKSLDRQDFSRPGMDHLSLADGAATLTGFTAQTIIVAQRHFPAPVQQWIVCGGGAHNATLMRFLREGLAAPVTTAEALQWDGDALEAQAFAYLAVRSLKGLPLSLPSTTGVPLPITGGQLYHP